MSWSIGATLNNDGAELLAQNALNALNEMDRTNIGNQDCVEERDQQIDAGIRAISQLLDEAIFEHAEEISIFMTGHANKDHKKASGWSNDSISISITVQSYKAE
jgi:hypothetical protein